MRILVIEDEPKTAAFLQKGLTENGFIVNLAHNGQDGVHLATTIHHDLIILDVTLPKLDGWSVLTEIRQHNKKIPVLFLSARDEIQARVKGLSLGADDYLIKPFSFLELLARIHSLLRRSQAHVQEPPILRIADLEIDVHKHKATRNSQRLDLTPKEFALLSLLARHQGQLLSRTLIAEQVWDMNFDSDTNVVDVAVRRLRSKLDDPFAKKLIHTIRGVGYVLEDR
ncbi:MAG: response regulator [Gammaproteobacteria bacterium]|nr:MAG: response regulator [Gammaproteobacteria bacterium]